MRGRSLEGKLLAEKPSSKVILQGVAEKSGPLNFFAVFPATVWDFNTKFYSFIYGNLLHLSAK